MADPGRPPAISRRAALLLCLFTSGMGLFIVLVAAGLIPAEESSFHAPRWVVGAAGLAFVLAGLAILTIPRGGSYEPAGRTPVTSSLLGGSIVGLLALITNWIAFGPGERRFSGGLALPFFSVSAPADEWSGRAAFGVGAVIMDLMAVWLAVRGARLLVRRWRERAGHPTQ
jgi:hypothetical protein